MKNVPGNGIQQKLRLLLVLCVSAALSREQHPDRVREWMKEQNMEGGKKNY